VAQPTQSASGISSARNPDVARGRSLGLDGLRGLAVLIVFVFHYGGGLQSTHWPVRLFGYATEAGWTGVVLFFALSGFLITGSLWDSRGSHHLLRNFYARRALRILPLYFLALVLAVLVALARGFTFADLHSLAIYALFLQDIPPFAVRVVTLASPLPLYHLWSVAVEEQFYLLWPVLFVLLGGGRRPRLLLVIFVGVMAFAPVARALTYLGAQPPGLGRLLSEYSFLNNFDALALGCAAAFALARWPALTEAALAARPRITAAVALALVLGPYGLAHALKLGAFTVPFGYTCEDLGIILLILQSVIRPGFGPYPLLNWAPVCRLGILSYSVYLWQQLFSTPPADFGQAHVWWLSFPGWLVPCAGVAWASYYGLERPFLRLRRRLRD